MLYAHTGISRELLNPCKEYILAKNKLAATTRNQTRQTKKAGHSNRMLVLGKRGRKMGVQGHPRLNSKRGGRLTGACVPSKSGQRETQKRWWQRRLMCLRARKCHDGCQLPGDQESALRRILLQRLLLAPRAQTSDLLEGWEKPSSLGLFATAAEKLIHSCPNVPAGSQTFPRHRIQIRKEDGNKNKHFVYAPHL